jgi:cellulose biosynthesis protein BcsQ
MCAALRLPFLFPSFSRVPMLTTRYVSISSQKGGVGKTTINILAASLFHFLGRERVAVIDCDYPQHSLLGLREKELAQLQADPIKAAEFQALGVQAYPIVGCEVKEALDVAREMDGHFDLVFIDTPGTINVPGLLELWRQLDYVFMPLEADVLSVEATLPFAAALEAFAKGQPGSRLQQYYAFWNKHIKTEKQEFYRRTEELFAQQNIPFLHSRLEQSVNYKKEAMRSTMLPLSREFMRLGISGLVQEMAQIIFADDAPAKATVSTAASKAL